jgi:hypothetical protein
MARKGDKVEEIFAKLRQVECGNGDCSRVGRGQNRLTTLGVALAKIGGRAAFGPFACQPFLAR